MANAALLYNNLADAGSVTASTAAALMPVSRLLAGVSPHIEERWRSSAEPAYFICDLGSSKSVDTVAVFGLTVAAGSTFRVRGSTADATGAAGDAFDSTVLSTGTYFDPAYGAIVWLRSAPATCRYIRVDLVDTPASYVEAGRLVVGARTAFTYNFAPGMARAWVDRSRKVKTSGGQSLIWVDNKFRTIDLNLEWVTAAQRDSLLEAIDLANGQHVDVLLILDTDSTNLPRDSIWGLISEPSPTLATAIPDIVSRSFKIEERL